MNADEVTRQLDLITDAGWGGAFVHARAGLTIDYLGDDWFRAVDITLARTADAGLKVWLYDEDKWPSGFSGGSVPLADERFRMRTLLARRLGAAVPPGCRPLLEHDDFIIHEWTATFGNPWFNGTSYTDLMSRDAVRRFIDDAYASYHARYAEQYGKRIVAEFTDEPCPIFRIGLPQGALPYSPELPARFREMHGYEPLEKLPLLFVDSPDAARFRLHYFRTINDLFERNFSQQIGEWCRAHGIDMTGHYMSEHELYGQQLWGTKIMPNYRHQDIPGIDFLMRQVDEVLPAKQCQSVVNQYGKRRMISELYGVSGQNLSFEDRWWIGCQQIALGVNVLNHHLSLFTMAGCRKRDYPPNLFYQQPWWPLNRVIEEPLSRLCFAMAQGRYVAEILVLHPQESTFVEWQSAIDVPDPATDDKRDFDPTATGVRPRVEALDAQFKSALNALLAAQRTFDLGDETILAQDATVERNSDAAMLRVGVMRYPLVVMPTMLTIAETTLSLLEEFLDAGGIVIRCGEMPTMVDGQPSPRLAAFAQRTAQVEVRALREAIAKTHPPVVQLAHADAAALERVLVHVRDLDDGSRLVFLTNLNREANLPGVEVRALGNWTDAEELDPWRGETLAMQPKQEGGAATVSLDFEPTRARLLRLFRCDARSSTTSPSPESGAILLDHEGWSVERLDDNALPLDLATWREGSGAWSSRPVPVVIIQQRLNELKYVGPIALRYLARVDGLPAGRKVHLVVEYPERYRITFNGQRIEHAGLPHWKDARWMPIDVTALVREGENVVEMTCDEFRHGDLTVIDDPKARYGTEIEGVFLVGDFAVSARRDAAAEANAQWREWRLPALRAHWLEASSLRLTEPGPLKAGDVTLQGLPFYAGRLRLTRELPAGATAVEVPHLDAAVASVELDGRSIGTFACQPYRVAIPSSAGGTLAVTLYGTLRNLLGPHHHALGELAAVTPWSFGPTFEGDVPAAIRAMAEGGAAPADWDDRYCVVAFGELEGVTP